MGKVLRMSVTRLRHVSVSRWGHKGSIENLQQVWYNGRQQRVLVVFPFGPIFNRVPIEARSRSHQWIARCGP
jgi:hypothetical protein